MHFQNLLYSLFIGISAALPAAQDSVVAALVERQDCPVKLECTLFGSGTTCSGPCVKCGFEGGWVSYYRPKGVK
jgi:hypothetical protein